MLGNKTKMECSPGCVVNLLQSNLYNAKVLHKSWLFWPHWSIHERRQLSSTILTLWNWPKELCRNAVWYGKREIFAYSSVVQIPVGARTNCTSQRGQPTQTDPQGPHWIINHQFLYWKYHHFGWFHLKPSWERGLFTLFKSEVKG